MTELPWRGWTNALVRARIPCLPVHADHIGRDADRLSVLILPNLAAMSAAQVKSVQGFVERGGSLIATDQSSRCNEWGEPLADFALAGLFGAHVVDAPDASSDADRRRHAIGSEQTYLRLTPELARSIDGPHVASEPAIMAGRHPVLKGFDETDILQFGGVLEPLRVDSGTTVLATFIPAFPNSPPEEAWMPSAAHGHSRVDCERGGRTRAGGFPAGGSGPALRARQYAGPAICWRTSCIGRRGRICRCRSRARDLWTAICISSLTGWCCISSTSRTPAPGAGRWTN